MPMTLQRLKDQLEEICSCYPHLAECEVYSSYNYGDYSNTEAIQSVENLQLVAVSPTGYASELKLDCPDLPDDQKWNRWQVNDPNDDEQPVCSVCQQPAYFHADGDEAFCTQHKPEDAVEIEDTRPQVIVLRCRC